METSRRSPGGKQLTRQRSRLQMHAPSSIQVAAPAASEAADWKVAIPLLSPLDIVSIPHLWDRTADGESDESREERRQLSDRKEEGKEKEAAAAEWSTWQHPAAPFYYEPVPGNAPVFLLPHCA